jgi:ATP-dependent DNA helicase RecG
LTEVQQKAELYPKITAEIAAGHQAYWICKAIDDNTKTETTSVKSRTEKLKKLFPKLKIEYLHGRMKPAEKDEIMARFSERKIDLLVSTTVVEVGVDVPNSTLMVIEDAENYGLAQLHQLRGRIGRGSAASSCFLLTSGDNPPSRRLKELERSSDGFYLAEVDLKLRGPGEIYGALQHGALDLRIATLSDTKLIKRAQADTAEFLKDPDNLLKYTELMDSIKKYQQLTTLN